MSRARTFDEFGRTRPVNVLAWCQRCHGPILYRQPYMPRIPMVGGWRGFDHQFCPPRLVRTS